MRFPLRILALASLCLIGCGPSTYVKNVLLDTDLGPNITSVDAAGGWGGEGSGHGLRVEVFATRNRVDYRRNLELELEGAAKVCAALAERDSIFDWAWIGVKFHYAYRDTCSDSPSLGGVADVVMRRDTFRMLRERNAPWSEYPEHWRLFRGYKEQPNSKALLSW